MRAILELVNFYWKFNKLLQKRRAAWLNEPAKNLLKVIKTTRSLRKNLLQLFFTLNTSEIVFCENDFLSKAVKELLRGYIISRNHC